MTLPKETMERIEREAQAYVLNIEWHGDDYGARKKYYVDCYKYGALAEANRAQILLDALETIGLGPAYYLEENPETSKKEALESCARIARMALTSYRAGERK